MKANKKRLYKDVEFLTSIRPYRNFLNTETLEKVADYIRNEFKKAGFNPETQIWKVKGMEYSNVIATYNKEKSKRLVIGAHYDVCGDQAGADDNASAVAGLLETARMVAKNKHDIDYRIDFVAYCLEEPPFFGEKEMGSYVHAKSLYDQKVDVLGMVCYEMIGYYSDIPGSQHFPVSQLAKSYPDTGNFILVVGIEKYKDFAETFYRHMSEGSKIDVQFNCSVIIEEYARLSDQRNYQDFGFPALMINDTSMLRNPHYHQASDTIETLDFRKIKQVIEAAYNAVCKIA